MTNPCFPLRGPIFYIYVESSPFSENHLIEHCCHSEYNVLCLKVLMIVACLRYSLSSENFTSSLRLTSQEVPGVGTVETRVPRAGLPGPTTLFRKFR